MSVIGGGLMGNGIAQVAVQNGFMVTVVDVNETALSKTRTTIEKNIMRISEKKYPTEKKLAENFASSCLTNLNTSICLQDAVSDVDLVIEAVVEKLESKHKIFKSLEQFCRPESILVSNTSSISLKEIGKVVRQKDRFAGLHFFNPVPKLKLVEVIRVTETSNSTFQALLDFVNSLNKVPIVCRDTPGFVVNRLLIPYLLEAIRLYERGDASLRDIDLGMKLGAGHPMGPLELADFVGLDTIKFICESFAAQLPDDVSLACPKTLHDLVEQGKLGRKSGSGFFTYNDQGQILS